MVLGYICHAEHYSKAGLLGFKYNANLYYADIGDLQWVVSGFAGLYIGILFLCRKPQAHISSQFCTVSAWEIQSHLYIYLMVLVLPCTLQDAQVSSIAYKFYRSAVVRATVLMRAWIPLVSTCQQAEYRMSLICDRWQTASADRLVWHCTVQRSHCFTNADRTVHPRIDSDTHHRCWNFTLRRTVSVVSI